MVGTKCTRQAGKGHHFLEGRNQTKGIFFLDIHDETSNKVHRKSLESIKFIYSEKATKFCEISTLDLPYVVPVKSTVEISQNFVAFSEYMKFTMKMYELMGYLALIANMF